MLRKYFLILIAIFMVAKANQYQRDTKVIENNVTPQILSSQPIDQKNLNYDEKIFTMEYTYTSSEDDSKNSSRNKAIEQIKILLSEEIGTHIESYLEINKQDSGGVSSQSIKKEIRSLSVGITKLKLLDEKWNGKTYYIKASVQISEKQTMNLLLESIKSKATEQDVERLNKILEEQKLLLSKQNDEVEEINKKLISQEIINEASKNDVLEMKQQLIKYNTEEIKQQEEAQKYKTEIEKKKVIIKELNAKAQNNTEKQKQEWLNKKELLCSFEMGTPKNDIQQITGSVIISYEPYYNGWRDYRYGESRNSVYYAIKSEKTFKYKTCPNEFLNNLGFNCIYFNFENDLLTGIAGCDGEKF